MQQLTKVLEGFVTEENVPKVNVRLIWKDGEFIVTNIIFFYNLIMRCANQKRVLAEESVIVDEALAETSP